VARSMLGCKLVHQVDGRRIAGRIVEVEAYAGSEDAACHGYRGKTTRNAPLFGPAGYSYVYLIYGMYWLANVIAKPPDIGDHYPAAVLLRALEPVEGLEQMAVRRSGRSEREWTSGPGRLTMALGIDQTLNNIDLTADSSPLFLERGETTPDDRVSTGPRIGLNSVPEPWHSIPWRFWIKDNPYISKGR
jgi:DNA-3-methyladenine glycosylase